MGVGKARLVSDVSTDVPAGDTGRMPDIRLVVLLLFIGAFRTEWKGASLFGVGPIVVQTEVCSPGQRAPAGRAGRET